MIIALAGKAGTGKDTFADFVTNNLPDNYQVHRLGFADPVRAMTKTLFSLSNEEISDRSLKEKKIEKAVLYEDIVPGSYSGFNDYLMLALTRAFGSDYDKWPRNKAYLINTLANFLSKNFPISEKGLIIRKSPRELLQIIGTEFGRRLISEDVWINRLKNRIDGIRNDEENHSDMIFIVTDCRFMNESDVIYSRDDGIVIKIERDVEACDNSGHESEKIDVKWDYSFVNDGTLLELEDQVIDFLRYIGLFNKNDKES